MYSLEYYYLTNVRLEETLMSDEIKQALEEMETRIIAAVKQELNPKARKEKRQKQVFHNTKCLLKNYGKFVEHYKQTEFVAEALVDGELLDVIYDKLDNEDSNVAGDVYIKSLFRTKERTAIILNHISKSLSYLEDMAKSDHNSKKQRIANVLKMMYIEGMTAEDIASKLNVDRATVFRDLNAGVDELSPLLFGIDGLKME